MDTQPVTERDLLRVAVTAAERLRAEQNAYRVQVCLAYLDRLTRYDDWTPTEHPPSTPPQWAALADFAADCAHSHDWVWQWGAASIRQNGFDPVRLVIQHREATGSSDYGHAVATFDPDPDNYRFIPVSDLPDPQTLHRCHHVAARKQANRVAQEQQGRLARLLRPISHRNPIDEAV